FNFGTCILTEGVKYYIRIIANGSFGGKFAQNDRFEFVVGKTLSCNSTSFIEATDVPYFYIVESNLFGSSPGYSSASCDVFLDSASTGITNAYFSTFDTKASHVAQLYDDYARTTQLDTDYFGALTSTVLKSRSVQSSTGDLFIKFTSGGGASGVGWQLFAEGQPNLIYPVDFVIEGIKASAVGDTIYDYLLDHNGTFPYFELGVSNGTNGAGVFDYYIDVRDSSNSTTICSQTFNYNAVNLGPTLNLVVGNCNGLLSAGQTYLVDVKLKINNEYKAAINNRYEFTVRPIGPQQVKILGVGKAGEDTEYDQFYAINNVAANSAIDVTVKWELDAQTSNANAIQSFDVLIKNMSDTILCSQEGLGSGSVSAQLTTCNLSSGSQYKVNVFTKDSGGVTLPALNQNFIFMAQDFAAGSEGGNDPSFNAGAIFKAQDIAAQKNYGLALEVQGGDIIVAGYQGAIGASNIFVKRYNSSLNLDYDFSNYDVLSAGADDKVYSLTKTSDGGFVAVGSTNATGVVSFLVLKLKSDLTLDTSFAQSGVFIFGDGSSSMTAYSVQQDAAGRIIVAGKKGSSGGYVIRLNSLGELIDDLLVPMGGSISEIRQIKVHNGKIYGVGTGFGSDNDMAVVRLINGTNLTLDGSFNSVGYKLYALAGTDKGLSIVIDKNEQYAYISGQIGGNAGVARFDIGSVSFILQNSFTQGTVLNSIQLSWDESSLYLGGNYSANSELAVYKLDSLTLSLDSTFDGDGIRVHAEDTTTDELNQIIAIGGTKLYGVGMCNYDGSTSNFCIFRIWQ
ncbi:MAG: hypothetical protein KDD50_15955, partial [Bdellovibrionales bacterium]|nr:hypothetical protein [Bdellovibrionales bacterium]